VCKEIGCEKKKGGKGNGEKGVSRKWKDKEHSQNRSLGGPEKNFVNAWYGFIA
jgi:hypothetical protein